MRSSGSLLRGALLVALAVASGCGTRPVPPEKDGAKADPATPAGPDGGKEEEIRKAPARASLAVKDLFEEYQKDQAAFHKKYVGGVLEVSGAVAQVGWNPAGQKPFIKLELSRGGLDPIECVTIQREPWAVVAPGQEIKIRGRFTGKDKSILDKVVLEDCVIVDAGKSTAIPITAEELTREFAANRDKAKEKYGNSDARFLVSGEVANVRGEAGEKVGVIELKGHGNMTVNCVVDGQLAQKVKPGQKIKVLGLCEIGVNVGLFGPALPIVESK